MFVRLELLVAIMSQSFITLHLLVFEIAKCIAWGRLLLLYKNYIVYYNVYSYYYAVFIENYVCTKFRLDWLLCQWVTWQSMSLS